VAPGRCRSGARPIALAGRHRHYHNLGSHKGAGVRQAIEASGVKLIYPPPYSPDFNPIEKAFSKLKALLRKAAEAERTVDGLWNRIGELLHAFTPSECANFFAAAEYKPL
jgi:transposase